MRAPNVKAPGAGGRTGADSNASKRVRRKRNARDTGWQVVYSAAGRKFRFVGQRPYQGKRRSYVLAFWQGTCAEVDAIPPGV